MTVCPHCSWTGGAFNIIQHRVFCPRCDGFYDWLAFTDSKSYQVRLEKHGL